MSVRQKTGLKVAPPYGSSTSVPYSARGMIRRKPKARFFVILGAILAVAMMVALLMLRANQTFPVETGKAEFSATYDMLIIRSELVYEAKNYGKTEFIAEEGQRVAAGDEIAEVYSWEYNDDTLSQLLDLQSTILDYEINVSRAGIIDEKLTDINNRISAKVAEIEGAVVGNRPQDSLSLQRELEALMGERTEYMKSVAMPDDTLQGYYSDEEALLETISAWRTALSASRDGVVSFYFDGCEALMTPANIGGFTEKALLEVEAGKTIETEESDAAYAPLYRIVDTTDWYVVMYSKDAIPEMHEGNAFSLIFDDYLDNEYTGVVYNATTLEKNGGFVYTVRIRDDIGPLIGERRVTAKLYGEQEGLRVPKGCVKTVRSKAEESEDTSEDVTGSVTAADVTESAAEEVLEDVTYVETADGQYVPVLVIADDGDYYLVQTFEGQGSLSIGQRIRG
jgi:hypothetical protein